MSNKNDDDKKEKTMKESVMPSMQGVVDELNILTDAEWDKLVQIHKAVTPGAWVCVEAEGPRGSKGEGVPIMHGVAVSYQGKPFLATHFLRIEDTRFVAAVHKAFPGLKEKLRQYEKALIALGAKLDQERAKHRDSDAVGTALAKEKQSLLTEHERLKKFIDELEKRTTVIAQESAAHQAAVKKLNEEVSIRDTKLAQAGADIARLKGEVDKAKTQAVSIRQERPIGVGRAVAGRRYITNSLWFRQLPPTGCMFKLEPLTLDEVCVLLREPFTSAVHTKRVPQLPKRLSQLLGADVRPGVGFLELKPGDDAIIVEYRGYEVPNHELSPNEFRAWQTGLQWFHLRVIPTSEA